MLEGPVTLTSAVSTMKKVNKENGKVFIKKKKKTDLAIKVSN
jgi:hypothetical protein